MRKATPTKGYWKVQKNTLGFSVITKDCKIATMSFDNPEHEMKGNARLIAAAPELLEACIRAEKHHQGGHSEIGAILREVIKKATKP